MEEVQLESFNQTQSRLIDLLLTRRSTLARDMTEPGPNKETLMQILASGARVPDHGKLAPWKFIVMNDESQSQLGEVIAKSVKEEKPESTEVTLESLKRFAVQAPTLVAVVSTPDADCKIPVWEQHLSAGAACQNILLAAISLGFAAQWLTGQAAYSNGVNQFFDLGEHDQIAGFIFIGSPSEKPLKERPRPELSEIISWR